MPITRNELMNRIYTSHPTFTKIKAREAVEAILQIIKDALANGEDVLLSGFGKFNVKDKSTRKGRNPRTGKEMLLDARRVVTFKASGKLRQKVNGR
jgi:integration host factor subunit alpha